MKIDNRLLELVVFLATIAAAIGYLSQLGPSTGEVAKIALAEIFSRQQVVRVERERFVVIVEALVDLGVGMRPPAHCSKEADRQQGESECGELPVSGFSLRFASRSWRQIP